MAINSICAGCVGGAGGRRPAVRRVGAAEDGEGGGDVLAAEAARAIGADGAAGEERAVARVVRAAAAAGAGGLELLVVDGAPATSEKAVCH
jgi:hypothetical protein